MRNGNVISLYVNDDMVRNLDTYISWITEIGRAQGKQGRIASRSSVVTECLREFLQALDTSLSFAEVRNAVSEVSQQLGASKVWLVGAFAKGEQTSDDAIELIVEQGSMKDLAVFDYERSIAAKLGRAVDVRFIKTPLAQRSNAHTMDRILLYDGR